MPLLSAAEISNRVRPVGYLFLASSAAAADISVDRSAEHIRNNIRQGIRGQTLFSELPAATGMMMGVGTLMVLQAVLVRWIMPV